MLHALPKSSTPSASEKWTAQSLEQARQVLDHANFENSSLAAYRLIVLHDLGDDESKALDVLEKSDGENGIALAKDLRLAFRSSNKGSDSTGITTRSPQFDKEVSDKVSTDLTQRLPQSWFREFALESLYRNTNQIDRLDSLRAHQRAQDMRLLKGGFVLVWLNVLGVLAGAVIILIELIRMWRERRRAETARSGSINDGVLFGWKAVYGTVVAFLATKLALRQLFVFGWYYNPHVNSENAFSTSAMMALVYALSNGIALLYAYIFVMRPNKVRFLDGISLRVRAGKVGPVQMLVIGAITLFAAITLQLLASLFSMLIGLNGTSNPIATITNQITRSGDPRAIITLLGQFLILVPFIEEGFVRGFLYTALRQRMSAIRSILLSAIFFAALHLDICGFLSLFMLGVVFAYVVERTKSILPTMFAHGFLLCGMVIGCLLFSL